MSISFSQVSSVFAQVGETAASANGEAWLRTIALAITALLGGGGLLHVWSKAFISRWEKNEEIKRQALLKAEESKRLEQEQDRKALNDAQQQLVMFLKEQIIAGNKLHEVTVQNIEALTTNVRNANTAQGLMQQTLQDFIRDPARTCKFGQAQGGGHG